MPDNANKAETLSNDNDSRGSETSSPSSRNSDRLISEEELEGIIHEMIEGGRLNTAISRQIKKIFAKKNNQENQNSQEEVIKAVEELVSEGYLDKVIAERVKKIQQPSSTFEAIETPPVSIKEPTHENPYSKSQATSSGSR
ncbi:MAG: hypothetical protein ACI9IL_000734 [Rickettsiales bacterium]|jgi:hypothetical protein